MSNRVNVTITARDLTRTQLEGIRRRFHSLGEDADRIVGERTRQNFDRLRQSVVATRRDLMNMRGAIPDEDFFRLDQAIRRSQRSLSRGFGNISDQSLRRVAGQLRTISDDFQRLDEEGNIRVLTRIDSSGLRRADAELARWRREQGLRSVNQRVRVDVDNTSWRRRILRGLAAPFTAAARAIRGILSDGVGQGLADAFSGPGSKATIIAAAGALVTGVASYLGAGIAGILTLAFGAAFVGLGGFLAAKAKPVKEAWKAAAKEIKASWKDAGAALEPVVIHGIGLLRKLSDAFLPHFEEAMRHAQTPVQSFLDYFSKSLVDFGKRAFHPMMEGFDTLLAAFGPEWDDFMKGLGDSFGALGRTVTRHSGEIAEVLREVFGLITTIIDIVNFLTETWAQMARFFMYNVGAMEKVLGGFIKGLGYVGASIVDAFKPLGYLIPGFKSKIDKAEKAVSDWGDKTSRKLQEMGDSAMDWGKKMDRANKRRKLQVDIAGWKNDLSKARADLKKTTSQKAKAKLKADISQLQRQIKEARRELNALNGKTATTYVITKTSTTSGPVFHESGKYAHGGVIGSAATGGVRSNLVKVGEHGPEFVRLPAGSSVRSNPDSRRMMAEDGRMAGGIATLEIVSDDAAMLALFRRIVREAGGNFDIVFKKG